MRHVDGTEGLPPPAGAEAEDFTRRPDPGLQSAAASPGTGTAAESVRWGREDLNRAVLNALPAHIAVLNEDGVIIATNRAWDQFYVENARAGSASEGAAVAEAASARQGGGAGSGIGSSYLDACRLAKGPDSGEAATVLEGIRAVLDGSRDQFTLEYPCHSPRERRWFLLTVTPLVDNDDDRSDDANDDNHARGSGTGSSTEGTGRQGLPRRRGAVVAHLDITARRLAEEAMRQRAAELAATTRALKRGNAELDQFAYITSHDLRAPLRGIANLSQWIEEDMGDRFTPEAHRQMELLRGRVHRMEKMIDGILEYSRVGRVRSRLERIDVAALLAEVIDMLDPPAAFTIEVAAGMPVVVGERLRLQQVFLNLIGNAIKHHDRPDGRVCVGWRQPPDAPDFVEFVVSDDGPGIEPQYHEKIFVIFQTLQPRDKVEGTGLGLSLVKKIVESQGSVVHVESRGAGSDASACGPDTPAHRTDPASRGTTFRFTWPKERTA